MSAAAQAQTGESKRGNASGVGDSDHDSDSDSSSSSSSSGSSSSSDSDSDAEADEEGETLGALRPVGGNRAGTASDSDDGDWDFESRALTAEQVQAALDAGARAEAVRQNS